MVYLHIYRISPNFRPSAAIRFEDVGAVRQRFPSPPIWCKAAGRGQLELILQATLVGLGKFDYLILHDLGYVRENQAATTVLFELIAERYVSLLPPDGELRRDRGKNYVIDHPHQRNRR